ncbi:hypothetical protein OAU50_02045 [Planctomycetota bacterium]|nr:hypothetical protein [Planctomycetota bacterium]
MKQVYIEIARTETTPFSGELELVITRHDRSDSKYTMGVTMQEGQRRGHYSMQIPSDDDNAGVVVELFGSSERLTPLAQEPVEQSDVSRKYGGADIGFISRSRLAGLNAHLPFNLIEIPVITAPTNWRGLLGFRAIILNDDRISRAQARALINYATAGGTLIISPRSAASFNPETPAGKLFQVKSTTSPVMAKLSDFSLLLQELKPSAVPNPMEEERPRRRRGRRNGQPKPAVETEAIPETAEDEKLELERPEASSPVTLWPQSGRAVPVETATGAKGLLSRARVGAGFVLLLHVDVSESPFSISGESIPTAPLANLIDLTLQHAGNGRSVSNGLTHEKLARFTDIASKRIPGQAFMMISLFVYLLTAGLGLFFLARKIKRPEFYPVGLLLFAVVSVVLVFGGGEFMKRSGDKVRAVRVMFADESTDQTALVDIVCSYHMDGETERLQGNTNTIFSPSGDRLRGHGYGMPVFNMSVQGNEAGFELTDLERWQNVYHTHISPHDDGTVKGLSVREQDGSWKVTNRSSTSVRSILIGINTGTSKSSDPVHWFFIDELAVGQSKSLSRKDSSLPDNGEVVRDMIEASAGDDTDAVLALLNFDNGGWNAGGVGYRLRAIAEYVAADHNTGDFVAIGVLPSDTLPVKSLGAVDIDEDDIEQNIILVSTGIVQE